MRRSSGGRLFGGGFHAREVAEAVDKAQQEDAAGEIGLAGLFVVDADGLGKIAHIIQEAEGGEPELCAAVV